MARLDAATRNAGREGCKTSARAVLPVVFDATGVPVALLDVGAGEGHWSTAALELGVGEVHPLDLESHHRYGCTVYEWDADTDDLPLRRGARWPLALCLEMAEHVDPDTGDRLVAELCRVAEAVVWSAAIPGQTGDGHVNEQWPDYWNDRFNQHSWMLTDPFRDQLWERETVEPWYRQNLLLAVPHGATVEVIGDGQGPRVMRSAPPRALIDPVTWAYHRGVKAPGE